MGGSAIEASKIAGHADVDMTAEYTLVAPERQNELTRRIQARLAKAATVLHVATGDSHPLWFCPDQDPSLQPALAPGQCTMPKAFGSLKGVWDANLLFEDSSGTIRRVDWDDCRVTVPVTRQ